MENKSELLLSTDYPHELSSNLSVLIRKHGRKILREQKRLELEYQRQFPKDEKNYQSIHVAYQAGIVDGFIQKNSKALWEKNTFLRMSMVHLTKYLDEKSSVQVIESLMHIFDWNFQLKVERTWKSTGAEADFHKPDKIQRMSLGVQQISELERRNQEANQESNSLDGEDGFSALSDGKLKSSEIEEKSGVRHRKSRTNSEAAKREKASEDSHKGRSQTQEQPQKPQIPDKIKYESKMSISQRKSAKKAQKGKADAQCELGDFYMEEGTEHLDYNEAERWYLLSADQGYFKAQFQLGQLYNKGKGSVRNPEQEALRYFMKLAEENYPTAQCVLGVKYQLGQGVEQDLNKAVGYFKQAAAQGHVEAQRRLGDIYSGMGYMQEAIRWYRMASKSGDAYSAAQLKRFS